MTTTDDLLHAFEHMTTPESGVAPAFQQSGHNHTLICVRGDGNAINACPQDTLGRILCAVTPSARWWTLAWLSTVLVVIVLLIVSAVLHAGVGGVSGWLHRSHYSIAAILGFSAGIAGVMVAIRQPGRRRSGAADDRPPQ